MKRFLQKKLVGELSIEDFLQLKYGESQIELQKRFINYLVKDLFNTISEDDILASTPGGIMYQGRQLDRETFNSLKENADLFANSILWEVLSNEVKYLSNVRMYEKGNTDQDLLAGKCCLYILNVIDRKIKELSQLK